MKRLSLSFLQIPSQIILLWSLFQYGVADLPTCSSANDGQYIRHISNCSIVDRCDATSGQWVEFLCPAGNYFDLGSSRCDVSTFVECSKVCVSEPCLHNGTCYEFMGGYHCSYEKQIISNVCMENPCLNNGVCSEDHGGYHCTCPLDFSGINCEIETPPRLLVSEYGTRSVFLVELNVRKAKRLTLPELGMPNCVLYDMHDGRLYVAAEQPDQIVSVTLEGTDLRRVKIGAASEGMALDWPERWLFYSDYKKQTINRMHPFNGYTQVLINKRLSHPRSIVLDFVSRKLYWNDIYSPKIERANFDGTGREVVATVSGIPQALTLDPFSSKLYWCDDVDAIKEMRVDGQRLRQVVDSADKIKHCESIAVLKNRIFTVYLLNSKVQMYNRSGVLVDVFPDNNAFRTGKYKFLHFIS